MWQELLQYLTTCEDYVSDESDGEYVAEKMNVYEDNEMYRFGLW